MQRWFFADDYDECPKKQSHVSSSQTSAAPSVPSIIPECDWNFCVSMKRRLLDNEFVAVVGNCKQLGDWQLNTCLLMTKVENSKKWHANVSVPSERQLEYRYLVCAVDSTTTERIVRAWEVHKRPRKVPNPKAHLLNTCQDIFGRAKHQPKVSRGWLTMETIVVFKFFDTEINWRDCKNERKFHVKVTPINLRIHHSCYRKPLEGMSPVASQEEESSAYSGAFTPPSIFKYFTAIKPPDIKPPNDVEAAAKNVTPRMCEKMYPEDSVESLDKSTAFAFNEVATLHKDCNKFRVQPQYGTACGADEFVMFQLTVGDFEGTAYMIQLYSYGAKTAADEPPDYLGYHYVLPKVLTESMGSVTAEITSATTHRPIGDVQFQYLVVRPVPSPTLNMQVSYVRHWKKKWTGLDIGHRGCGKTHKFKSCLVVENTLYSMIKAVKSGADMLEFDVQVTKDLVPVIFHDFFIVDLPVKIEKKRQGVHNFTLDELKKLLTDPSMDWYRDHLCCSGPHTENIDEYLPFPLLEDVLTCINTHIGFNIEIKWPQRFASCRREGTSNSAFDPNVYVDSILDVVQRNAGTRRIVFSSFDADICSMVRMKQNYWPVMLLLQGAHEPLYANPIVNTLESAINFAHTMELMGLAMHARDLLEDTFKADIIVKTNGLVLFCYGEEMECKDTLHQLRNLDIHGLIYDRMDLWNSKHLKKSIFLLDARKKKRLIEQAKA